MFSHIPMSPRNIHFGVDLSPSLPLSVWGEGEREKEILSPNPKLGQLCLKTEVSINPISEGLNAGIVKKMTKLKQELETQGRHRWDNEENSDSPPCTENSSSQNSRLRLGLQRLRISSGCALEAAGC